MKKLLIACTALLLSAATFAQTDSTKTRNDKGNHMDHKTKKDCVMMKDGVMMQMKDGKATAISSSVTMSNGTTVMTDGTVTMQNGTKSMLKEGESMDMSGKMIPAHKDHMEK